MKRNFVPILTFALRSSLVFACLGSTAQASNITVVAAANSEFQSFSREEVADIFLQRKLTTLKGANVKAVFLVSDSPLTSLFSEELLGKSSKQLRAYWNLKVLSGRMKPPLFVQSSEDMIAYLKKHPDSVGYLNRSDISSELRVLHP